MSHEQRELLNPPNSIPDRSADESSPLNPIPGRLTIELARPGLPSHGFSPTDDAWQGIRLPGLTPAPNQGARFSLGA
jgi:hypothetical protein